MGRYLIKDTAGRLWARAITRKAAARILAELQRKQPAQTFTVEVLQ